jgi:hypothetical protein
MCVVAMVYEDVPLTGGDNDYGTTCAVCRLNCPDKAATVVTSVIRLTGPELRVAEAERLQGARVWLNLEALS